MTIIIAQVEGEDKYLLVDGAHRIESYLKKGIKSVKVEAIK